MASLRNSAEGNLYSRLHSSFLLPPSILSTVPGTEALSLPRSLQPDAALLASCTAASLRLFCWKDCALYLNSPALKRQHRMELFEDLYREWLPRRAADWDINARVGSWFAAVLDACPAGHAQKELRGARRLEEVVSFHRAVCMRVEDAMTQSGESEEWKLRPTFDAVILVADVDEWSGDMGGVLVVCRGAEAARELGLRVDDPTLERLESLDVVDTEGENWSVWRAALKRAMRVVISQDKERTEKIPSEDKLYVERYENPDEE